MYGRVGMTNYIEDLNDIIKRSEYTPKPIERKTKYPKFIQIIINIQLVG